MDRLRSLRKKEGVHAFAFGILLHKRGHALFCVAAC